LAADQGRIMRRYDSATRSNTHAPWGKCPECGWEGRDWGFKYHSACKQCFRQWGEKKTKNPSGSNVEITAGILVTEHVEARLRRRAQRQVGPRIMLLLAVIIPISMFLGGMHLYTRILDSGVFEQTRGLPALILEGGALIMLVTMCFLAGAKEHLVDRRTAALAKIRKENLEEQRLFYSSPEWRLLRAEVIREQGRCCLECGRHVAWDFDLTVDHIKPRSKFPELALDKSNLRVLCRQCNSSKGDAILGSTAETTDLNDKVQVNDGGGQR
jgi:hypothetical protein